MLDKNAARPIVLKIVTMAFAPGSYGKIFKARAFQLETPCYSR